MRIQNSARRLFAATVIFILSLSSSTLADSKKKKKDVPSGTPVLWSAPKDIASRNLYLGPGGAALRPDLRRITFIKEETGGYSKKYRVRDGSGREWVVKIGKEAQSETAAVRLVWAVGYHTEINYLVPRVHIPGKGTFTNVRFEARPKNVKRLDEWKWEKNPFVGTRELQGLIIMMAFLNNWDIKDSNNKILLTRSGRTRSNELRYVISDLGATFGKVKVNAPVIWRFARSRNEPEDYREDRLVDEVKGKRVYFKYGGKKQDLFDNITVDEARWIGAWLARLSNRQIRDAFRAANYRPAEVRMLTKAVRARINELVNLPG
ncbi:MAG TPA: hypothetical protein VD966_02935 [Pyrinomonadaceae bacterium]|nr:hypothetical protein [Pyrinomonadaceae bacterium]